MNRIIPRIGLLIPPRVSWARGPTAVWSAGAMALAFEVTGRSSVRRLGRGAGVGKNGRVVGSAVAKVEQRPLGADLRQVVEVVRRRRRGGRPFERVRLPWVVAGDSAAAE